MSSDNSGLLCNALLLTDPMLNKNIDGQISWLNAIRTRGARTQLYRAYERGDHRANLTEQMRAMLRLHTDDAQMSEFCLNYCSMVIDKMVSRLEVLQVTADDAQNTAWLAPLLREQDFSAQQAMWWRSATRDADTYVMVDLDTGLWTNEPAYDGFSGMTAIIDIKTRKPIWGAKLWAETDVMDKPVPQGIASGGTTRTTMHVIVYQPGRISYWRGLENTQVVEPEAQEGAQDFEFTEINTGYQAQNGGQKVMDGSQNMRLLPNELGDILPFVIFSNKRDSFTRYGESELRAIIPLQDLQNRTLYNLAMASDLAAFKIKWSKGFEIDPAGIVPGGVINMSLKDEKGKPLISFTPDQLAFISAAQVGEFAETDTGRYLNILDKIAEAISQVSQTPIHGRTESGVISGEALGQLESGLVSKVVRFQQHNTDAVKELFTLTAKIQRVFHPEKKAPMIDTVDVLWKSAEPRNTLAEVAALVQMRKDTGNLWPDEMYRQKLGALYGMSEEEISEWEQKAQKQQDEESERMIELANVQAEVNATKIKPTNEQSDTMPANTSVGNFNPAEIEIANNNKQPMSK